MCGIVGIYSHEPVAAELHESLIHLQHRGQDAAGVVTSDGVLHGKHGHGLVREIFKPQDIAKLTGHVGIAHVRYPTAGGHGSQDIQPFWTDEPLTLSLAHNGNLTNHQVVASDLNMQLQSAVDSEVMMRLLVEKLAGKPRDDNYFLNLCHAVTQLHARLKGSYSVVALIPGKGLIAFRDPHGIRPLVWGERKRADGRSDYIFASETTPFYALGFEPKGDLAAGEMAYVNEQGELFREMLAAKPFTPCVFEYVYFARPDATLDGVSVYRARLRMGQNLAKRWKETYPDILPDVVIPVPFTSNTAALSFAHELGVRYSEGLYKNPFIGRTFIMPNQKKRARSVRQKLTPQRTEIENKKVLILDDSIVRGTTSREIIKMVREFGAKEIYLVSACPPITHPCFYGIDMPTKNELIAAQLSTEQIRESLGVEKLLYQTQDDLIEAVTRRGDHVISRPCMACMDGDYVCGVMQQKFTETTN